MPFKSKAQRRKCAELLVNGKISPETYEEWNRSTGGKELPERVKPKAKKAKKTVARPWYGGRVTSVLAAPPLMLAGLFFGVLGGITLIAALVALRRRRPFRFILRTLVGLLLLSLGALAAAIGLGMQGYRALTREELAARIVVQPLGPQLFSATVHIPGRPQSSYYELAGDALYVDAHILKWHPAANVIGLHTAYELDRISGRYDDIERERSAARTVHTLVPDRRVDLFGADPLRLPDSAARRRVWLRHLCAREGARGVRSPRFDDRPTNQVTGCATRLRQGCGEASPLGSAALDLKTGLFQKRRTAMAHISLIVGVFVLSAGALQQPPVVAPPASGQLRWVRGSVTEVSPASVAVQLRDKTLTVTLDRDTRVVRPTADATPTQVTVGSLVEVHYVDKKPVQRAVVILSGTLGTAKVPRRAGHSYRGVISRTKSRDVYVRVDTKNRMVKMDSKTQLTGVDGQPLAIGWKDGITQLFAGEEILVTWNQQEDDLIALEIRRLGNEPAAVR